MTTQTDPTGQISAPAPAYEPSKAKRVVEFGFPALCIGIVAVLVLGFAGGIAAQSMFPAKQGPVGAQGKEGKQGQVGQAGPIGPAGNAANINLSSIGYCFNYDTQTSGTSTWVTDVTLYAPTDTNGTQSCPTGSFVPLQPVSSSPSQ